MQTPSFAQTVQDIVESRLTGLHTMLPGKITKIDLSSGKCDVQPLLQRLGAEGSPVTLPVITNCPIGFYRAGKAAVFLPLKVGDYVEIRFCERSIDVWLSKGGTVDPADKRKHNLSDAVVYPGMYPFTDPPVGADAAKLVIINDKSKISMTAAGEISIKNDTGEILVTSAGKFKIQGASDEFLTLVSDLVNLLTQVQTQTMLGPQPFLPTYITQLNQLKTKIDGMKG